jgi:hypothetical protein
VPYLVPPTLTVWDTAAAPESQIFSLVGVLVMLPIILGYTAFVCWTFRGKVREGEGYQCGRAGSAGRPKACHHLLAFLRLAISAAHESPQHCGAIAGSG